MKHPASIYLYVPVHYHRHRLYVAIHIAMYVLKFYTEVVPKYLHKYIHAYVKLMHVLNYEILDLYD